MARSSIENALKQMDLAYKGAWIGYTGTESRELETKRQQLGSMSMRLNEEYKQCVRDFFTDK